MNSINTDKIIHERKTSDYAVQLIQMVKKHLVTLTMDLASNLTLHSELDLKNLVGLKLPKKKERFPTVSFETKLSANNVQIYNICCIFYFIIVYFNN